MHKSTIFLAIFAFFSITILLENQFNAAPSVPVDNLQANSAFFQTSPNSKNDTKSNDLKEDTQSNQKDTLSQTEQETFNAEFFKDFLKTPSQDDDKNQSISQTQEQTSKTQIQSKLEKYFAAIDIQDLEISLDENQTLIFDTIDLSNEDFQSFQNFKYTKKNSLMAKGTEITFEDTTKASYFYTLMQAVTKSYEGIQINKNNQFQESFYINNPSKPFFVSLVIMDNNKIYCFSYHKDIHDKFKGFYEILL